MSKDHEPTTDPENRGTQLIMEKYFRQVFNLLTIIYEIRKTQGTQYFDYETQRVLLDTNSWTEDTEEVLSQDSEPVGKTQEIVNEVKTWIKVLEDGKLEIVVERWRYDQGFLIPHIPNEDLTLAHQILNNRRADQEDAHSPLEAFAAAISNSPHTTLGRYKKTFIITSTNLGGTIQASEELEEFDYDGSTIKDEETPSVTYSTKDREIHQKLIHLFRTVFQKIRNLLDSVTVKEDAEIPDLIRKRLAVVLLNELHIAEVNNIKLDETEDIEMFGGAYRIENEMISIVEFHINSQHTDESGIIRIEQTQLWQYMEDTYMAAEIEISPTIPGTDFEAIMMAGLEPARQISVWQENQLDQRGISVTKDEIRQEIQKLKSFLQENQRRVYGQTRIMSINPRTGTYTYSFVRREPKNSQYNLSGKDIYISHTENFDAPSTAELSTLLALTL